MPLLVQLRMLMALLLNASLDLSLGLGAGDGLICIIYKKKIRMVIPRESGRVEMSGDKKGQQNSQNLRGDLADEKSRQW